MNGWALDILCCPCCGGKLKYQQETLNSTKCGQKFPIVNKIPRFVETEAYCSSFGWQWNRFGSTQVDFYSGTGQSERRFRKETGWIPEDIRDRLVLDAGCGSGRFSDIALRFGGKVIAVDISSSVDACYENLIKLGHNPEQFLVIQASLYSLPFKEDIFERAFSIGVIQHTPDRKKCVVEISSRIKSGGEGAFWAYEKSWRNWAYYKYYFRFLTRHFSQSQIWALSRFLVGTFFPIAWEIDKIPKVGKIATRAILPIAYRKPEGATYDQAKEWSLLDTFDNLSPHYDAPMSEPQLRRWMNDGGLSNVKRQDVKGLAMKGVKR